MKNIAAAFLVAFTLPFSAVAEEKTAEKETDKKEKKEAVARPVKVGDMVFKYGKEWKLGEPSSRMVKAFLEVEPGKGLEKVGAKFYYFGAGQGGSAEANVARWIGQFEGEPKVEEKEIDKKEGNKVTIVHATGTYLDGPPFGQKTPKPGFALLGAIVEGGDAPVFIKLTGPETSVKAVKKAFETLAASPFEK